MGRTEGELDRYALPLAGAEAALAVVLGAIALGSKSLWFDEVYSITTASGSWRTLYRSWRNVDPNMSLYGVLLHLWRGLGTSDAAMRSLSVLAFAATVLVVYALGRRLFDTRCGLIAGLVMAIAPFGVHFAQEARSYALAMLLVSLASYAFVVGIDDPSWLPWTAFAVFGALAFSAHYFSALVLLALGLSLVFRTRDAVPWRLIAWSAIGLAVLALPGLWLATGGEANRLSWIGRPDLHGAFWQPASMAGGTVLALVLFGLVLLAAWSGIARWRASGRGRDSWVVALVMLWLVVPWALSLGYSLVFSPVFLDRYLIVSLPALAIAAGFGVTQLDRRWATVAVVAVVAVSAVQLTRWYRASAQEDWRAVVAYTATHAQPGDGIAFCVPELRTAYDYYADAHPDIRQPRATDSGAAALPDRLWLARAHEAAVGGREAATTCGLADALRGYELVTDRSIPGVQLQLYRRKR